MGALTQPLAAPGPLFWMAEALQARLQAVFPPSAFSFLFMPAKPDRAWASRYLTRFPAVALGWNGSDGEKTEGMPWTAQAHWTVALIIKNARGVQERYVGDALSPGLFAMQRVATLALHGWLIDPEDTEWCAQGTCIVNAAGNLYQDEWGDQDMAVCGLDLTVLYEETLAPGLEPNLPTAALVDAITWNFGEQPPLLTQTIDTGTAS